MSAVLWSYVLWFLGTNPFLPPVTTGFLIYAPLLFGFWIGFRRSGSPWGTYALNSFFVGLLGATTVGVFEWAYPEGQPEQILTVVGFLLLILVGFVGPFLLFFSGTLLGTFVKRQVLGQHPARFKGDSGSDDMPPSRADRTTAYIAAGGVVIAAFINKLPEIITALAGSGN